MLLLFPIYFATAPLESLYIILIFLHEKSYRYSNIFEVEFHQYKGRARKGFDFLRYQIGTGSPDSVQISQTSIQRVSMTRAATYLKHERRWAVSELGYLNFEMTYLRLIASDNYSRRNSVVKNLLFITL